MIKPGDTVIASYGRRNPATGIEAKGVVLDECDPAAWAGSVAFPEHSPRRADVEKHVAWCHANGLKDSRVAVRWSFGKVYWEDPKNLIVVKPEERCA